ncbi:MAG: hypothetical protein CM15mP58_23520 [Burkholderiaceae bacterium]|nr:MAG: hypothetical protein CM15mP58_23520 [Burkholderiaceae bacterium]
MGVATIIPVSGLVVRGVLWQISKSDEKELDTYEVSRLTCIRKKGAMF